jgi:predicted dehydrogenase
MVNKVKIGIIGTGNISSIYIQMARKFEVLDLVACADLILERAKSVAEKHAIPRAISVDELLADPEIEIVVNLTTPGAHASLGLASLISGKSIYNEKPLALEIEQAKNMLLFAEQKKLRVGCAPDTFLGAGLQTCRKLIDEGMIGHPVAATAFMLCHGHESWHPDPEFYYQAGGGPMFDMGPYYLTALVNLLGPVVRVTGSTRISSPERTITSMPKAGKLIRVEVPTHVVGVLDFRSGAVATLITSFDVWSHQLPKIEIYGSEGTLSVPDPNTFGGPVRIWKTGSDNWMDIPLVKGYQENSRCLGVADMATALRSGRAHRASGKLAYHVLEIMHAIHDASRENRHVILESSCEPPLELPHGLPYGILDD